MGESERKPIAVVGGTGFVGRHAVRELTERGWPVRVLARDAKKASSVLPDAEAAPALTIIEGDPFDDAALARLGDTDDGLGGLLNCVGLRREVPGNTFARAHVGVVERTLGLLRERGGDGARYLLVSALGVGPNAETEYARSKFAGETLVRRSGLGWTIFRPSVVHGPDGEMCKMLKGWALGRSAPFVFMPWFCRVEFETGFPPKPPRFESAVIAPVAVSDVARAIARSMESDDAEGEVYPLCGPEELTWPEFLRFARDHVPMASSSKPVLGLPGHLCAAMAVAAKPLGLASALPFGPSEPLLAIKDNTAETDKAREHLGFEPAGFREQFAAYADRI